MQDATLNADGDRVVRRTAGGPVVLRDEREKRGESREELAEMAGISPSWLRAIEEKGEKPSQEVKDALRAALERCPVHERFGIKCGHKLPVPTDEELYSPSQR